MTKIPRSETEWKKKLTSEQYKVLREKGTELPFTGKLLYNKETGMYLCAGCGSELFSSKDKFDSGTGWPSFTRAAKKDSVILKPEPSIFGEAIEVICKKCGSHLGHVFDDGPAPAFKRYCINSCALGFEKGKKQNKT